MPKHVISKDTQTQTNNVVFFLHFHETDNGVAFVLAPVTGRRSRPRLRLIIIICQTRIAVGELAS